MKYLLFIYLYISITQLANAQVQKPFEIPRSTVIDIKDDASGKVYPIFVKLPRSYRSNAKKAYPVIYLTDALYSFQIVSGATRFPMNTGKMEEAIIVGISYSKGSKGPSSRIRDYTHVEDATWKYQTGDATKHINFIEKSVFPYIAKHYRVSDSRTFIGNSLGGLLGAYILFTKPAMFNNYILGSPSVWFKEYAIIKVKTAGNLNKQKVFIGVGANESPEFGSTRHNMIKGAQELSLKISHELFPHTQVKLLTIEGANHETAFPTTAIQGLYWLFKKTDY